MYDPRPVIASHPAGRRVAPGVGRRQRSDVLLGQRRPNLAIVGARVVRVHAALEDQTVSGARADVEQDAVAVLRVGAVIPGQRLELIDQRRHVLVDVVQAREDAARRLGRQSRVDRRRDAEGPVVGRPPATDCRSP